SFYGFILANSISFENPITVYGSVTTRHLTMKNGVVIQKPDYSCPIAPPAQQCTLLPMETFSSNNIDNWSVIGYGNSVKPTVESGRFRLNGNTPRQATASAYNYIFPSNENYLEIEFDHYAYGGGSNGADGVALVISDANVPPQTGAFGGPLGYGMKLRKNHSGEVSQDVEGFAGGWLGIGIDEYGNFYREGGVQLASRGKANNVGIRGAGVKDRNGKWLEGYQYIKGHQFDGDLDNRENARHRYKVILNSRKSGVITLSVQRKIKNGQWSSVISDFDVLTAGNFNYTPDNFRISVTASTGALTNTHEMDDFQVCADKYQKITEGIHHFEFDYAGTGSICQASEVTLRACMNDSCSKTYPASVLSSNPGASIDPVTVSLLPQSSSVVKWEGGDSVTFSDSISLKLQAYQSGSAKLGIASSSVPQFGFEGAKCRIAGGALSEQNCNILFNSAALGVNIPDKVAGKPFFTDGTPLYGIENRPYLEFCSAPSQQDGAGEHRDVIFSVERVEPEKNAVQVETYVSFLKEDGKFSEEVAIDNKASKEIDDVYFDSKGKAYFNLRYPEAGKVALKAKIKGEKDSLGQNSFVSFPAYLQLTVDGGLCGASDSCDKSFVAAGEPFTMKATAYQFGDDKKPAQNYQQSGLTVSHKVTYPAADAAVSGTLGTTAYDHLNLTKGTGSFEQTVSEVGAFEFIITPPETYLGSKSFAITPAKEVIGRFYPKYFRTDEVKNNQWAYPDGQSFTYMEQAFGAKEFYVEALNADKGAVTNYAFFSDGLHARFGLKDTSSYEARFSSNKTYSGTWLNNGTAYVTSRSLGKFAGSTTDGLVFSKGSGASYPDGPLNLYENAKDTTISIKGISANSDPVSIDGNDGVLTTQPDIRFGRIDLDDVGGNQGSTLHVPLRVEYWNGSRFIANPNDNQTDVKGVTAAERHIWPTGADADPKAVTLGAGGEVSSGSSRSVTATQAEPYRQQTRVWLDLDDSTNGLPWLKYNWDNKNAGEENPSSVVTFGIHRGNDRVIYRGEPGLTGQ
ncbi:MSHA biogenesis protein MshQ, partial [Vibrio parahaemolyticus]